MVESRNYTITIKAASLEKRSPISGSNRKTDTDKSKGLLSTDAAKTYAAGYTAYKKVKSFATQIINNEVSMVRLRTGSNELQERASFMSDIRQQGLGLLEGAITGALVGGLPGFIAGTAMQLLSTTISITQRQRQINTQRSLENRSIQMNYIRAGANGSRHAYE